MNRSINISIKYKYKYTYKYEYEYNSNYYFEKHKWEIQSAGNTSAFFSSDIDFSSYLNLMFIQF